jgi:hypothetical protein
LGKGGKSEGREEMVGSKRKERGQVGNGWVKEERARAGRKWLGMGLLWEYGRKE